MQMNSKHEINTYLVGKCPVGISPKLGKSQMGMAVGKCPVGILPVGIAPDTVQKWLRKSFTKLLFFRGVA